tara:strand:+ start:368 stop:1144 length:777 start_codon:yes stop_codon:yes gene_type:complete
MDKPNKKKDDMFDDIDLEVLPVKDMRGNTKLKKKIHKNLPQIPSCGLIASPVCSGKTTLLSNLFLNDAFYKDVFDYVYILSPTIYNDNTAQHLLDEFEDTVFDGYKDEYLDTIINTQLSYGEKKDMPLIAIVIDDCVGDIKKGSKINFLITRYRHYNIGMIILSSQLFRAFTNTIRTNCNFVILPYQPNEKEQEKYAEEYSSFGGINNFKKIYEEATNDPTNPYSFLYLDIKKMRAYKTFKTLLWEKRGAVKSGGEHN